VLGVSLWSYHRYVLELVYHVRLLCHAKLGPYGAGIFDPRSWAGGSPAITDAITLELTRVVLAIGVFAIGVELPKAYMARHWKSLLFLLLPVMTWVNLYSSEPISPNT
jgi:NhaP-type Na+/H+ or K+/H+ antiporter